MQISTRTGPNGGWQQVQRACSQSEEQSAICIAWANVFIQRKETLRFMLIHEPMQCYRACWALLWAMLLSQLRAYSDAVTAADFERLCHTATEHVFVCVGPTVDKRAHQRTAGFLKNTHCQQDHSNQMYITNLVWGPRAGIIFCVGIPSCFFSV